MLYNVIVKKLLYNVIFYQVQKLLYNLMFYQILISSCVCYFYQISIFPPNDNPLKTMKFFFYFI